MSDLREKNSDWWHSILPGMSHEMKESTLWSWEGQRGKGVSQKWLSKPFTESYEKILECKTSLGFVAMSQLDSSNTIYTLKLLFVLCLNGKLKFDKVIWTNPDLMQSNWFRAVSTADFSVHWEFDIVRKSPCDSFHFKLQTNCPFWVFSLFLWLLFKCLSGKFFSIWCSLFQAFCFYPSLLVLWQVFFIFIYAPSLRNHIIWRSPKVPVFHSSLFSWLSTDISPLYSCSNISYIYSFLPNGCQNMQLLPPEYCEDLPPYLSKRGGGNLFPNPKFQLTI